MPTIEDTDSPTIEELLGPPKYDLLGLFMALLTALIVGVIAGVIVILLAFLAIGKFSLESGASPILLAFIAFIALTLGNLLYYTIMSRVFPHIYSRGRTSFSQITLMSMLLYVLFIPIYIVVSGISYETSTILVAFSAHVVINIFSLSLVMGMLARYRYSMLSLYSALIALVITSCIVVVIEVQIPASDTSSRALFLLLGLTILSYVVFGGISSSISWIYYRMYQLSGYDPIGVIFSAIEKEETELEKKATKELTTFHH